MPVLRRIITAPLWSLLLPLLFAGCPLATPQCPEATVSFDPPEIPAGVSETTVIIDVTDPRPELGFEVITEVTSIGGRIADPFARETTFTCAFDVSGPVEVCATATYAGGDGDASTSDASVPEGGMSEAGMSTSLQSEDPDVGVSYQYLRKPHIRLSAAVQCSETRCTTVICPEEKNACPEVSSLTVEPMDASDGGTATITVVATDADANPDAPLVTTLSATSGTITDPNAPVTTYTCDPAVGGSIGICVVASDGDSRCDVERCTSVRCPGDPSDNTCPIIEGLTARPMTIPPNETMAAVEVDVVDEDNFPDPLRTELTSDIGVFNDPSATETIFTCGESGPAQVCVEVTDGDPDCDKSSCITVQCPSTVTNLCPNLFILNAIPSTIAPGNTSTLVESRAQDTDGVPLPLATTMRALWGTIENDENISLPNNVVAQDATYVCDRPGDVEICVDATDGACLKTLCIEVTCPADIPPP